MNEYLIKEETLDNIAIQSMNLMGKTEAVSTSTIISDLTNVNSEVNSQTALIEQIASALEGKAVGGGPETCTISVVQDGEHNMLTGYIVFIDENGNLGRVEPYAGHTAKIMKNSLLYTNKTPYGLAYDAGHLNLYYVTGDIYFKCNTD